MWSITLSSSVLRIFITSSTDRLVECMCHKIVDPPSWKVSVPTSKQNQFCGFIISPHLSFSWSCVFFSFVSLFMIPHIPVISLFLLLSFSSCWEIPWKPTIPDHLEAGCAVGTCRIYAVMHSHINYEWSCEYQPPNRWKPLCFQDVRFDDGYCIFSGSQLFYFGAGRTPAMPGLLVDGVPHIPVTIYL